MKMYGRFTGLKKSGRNYNRVTACTTEVAISLDLLYSKMSLDIRGVVKTIMMVYPCKLDGRQVVASQTTHNSLFHFKIN